MKKVFLSLLMLLVMVNVSYARQPVVIGEKSPVVLRVLTRPMAKLYAEANETTVKDGNLPTFQAYFVYTRPEGEALITGSGFYEVGTDDKGTNIVGWIKGEDLFEWKQTMCLAYTHPEGRSPIFMFEDEDVLKELVTKDVATRKSQLDEFNAQLEAAASNSKPLEADFPIVAKEPNGYVDMEKEFYLLPILDHEVIKIDGREGRLLHIAAATAKGSDAREKSDIRTNTNAVKEATSQTTSEENIKKLEELKVDVVWAIDTTRSMAPYIQATLDTVTNASKELAKHHGLKDKIAFGVWAYRDSVEAIPDIEYTTKNFTPNLQNIDDFIKTMGEVKETQVDSVVFPEDMFAGVNNAITKTVWRENAIRLLVVVGDAPGHELGHKWNSSGLDEKAIRELADSNKVMLSVLHILPQGSKVKPYNKKAETQFRVMALNAGMDKPLYWAISSKDDKGFSNASNQLVSTFGEFANKPAEVVTQSETGATNTEAKTETKVSAKAPPTQDDIKAGLKAATVTWLGSETGVKSPRDIEAYVVDKDINNPTKQALDIRILLSKNQLNNLKELLSAILEAGKETKTSGGSFFAALQASSAIASRNADDLEQHKSLVDNGLIPGFLEGLPYKSLIMDMSEQSWSDMGPDEQDLFISELEAKLSYYQEVHNATTQWVSLNANDDPGEYVAAIRLEMLP